MPTDLTVPIMRRLFDARAETERRHKRIADALDNGYRWCPCGCGAMVPR